MDEQTPETTPPQDHPQPPQSQPPQPPPTYRPPAPPKPPSVGRRYWWVPVSCSVGCLPWFLLFATMIGAAVSTGTREPMTKHVALIRISGTITGGGGSADIWGGRTAGSEDIVNQLERARKSENARAIVLRIDSPGGSAAGSEEVWNEIMQIRKEGKPVYTSMGDVAASGGYYIASACNRIYADHNTLTGSIGVIFSLADMSELYRKIGYKPEVLKSGKFKDIGSPARPLSIEERKLLQDMIGSVYEKFVSSVAQGRGRKVGELRPIADGRLFTGEQALKLKLVDRIGGLRDTVLDAGKAGGIAGEPKVVEYKRRGLLYMLFGEGSEAASSRLREEMTRRMAEEILRGGRGAEGLR